MDKQTEIFNQMQEENGYGAVPSYYYNSNKVNENDYVYRQNPKQWKGEKGVKEGKHTRAMKPGKVVMK